MTFPLAVHIRIQECSVYETKQSSPNTHKNNTDLKWFLKEDKYGTIQSLFMRELQKWIAVTEKPFSLVDNLLEQVTGEVAYTFHSLSQSIINHTVLCFKDGYTWLGQVSWKLQLLGKSCIKEESASNLHYFWTIYALKDTGSTLNCTPKSRRKRQTERLGIKGPLY